MNQGGSTESLPTDEQTIGVWELIRSDFWRRIQLTDLMKKSGTEVASKDLYQDAVANAVPYQIGLQRRLAAIASPGFIACFLYRVARAANNGGVPLVPRLAFMLNLMICGIEIQPAARIGPGLFIGHSVGTTIGPVVIGRNCTLMSRVGLGSKATRDSRLDGVPTVGNNVWFMHGSGAAGPISIGDNARLGANALLIEDCPPGALVTPPRSRVITNPPPDW